MFPPWLRQGATVQKRRVHVREALNFLWPGGRSRREDEKGGMVFLQGL